MTKTKDYLEIDENSIKQELDSYKNNFYNCIYEYIWNSFDANATEVYISFKLPENWLWFVEDISISDNWNGWDVEDSKKFMSSAKKEENQNNKTLPKWKYWRWRYAFIWLCENIEIFSKNTKTILFLSKEIQRERLENFQEWTKILFKNPNIEFLNIFWNLELLENKILSEFGWFLYQNKNLKIFLNANQVDICKIIKEERKIKEFNFDKKFLKSFSDNLDIKIVLWKNKISEYSKFYFLDLENKEIFKENTSFNKKWDDFWHSVYIYSDIFKNFIVNKKEQENQMNLDFEWNNKIKILKRQIVDFIKRELTSIRRPLLKSKSQEFYDKIEDEKILPDLQEFGIYDEESYEDLIKTAYIIHPSIFSERGKNEKKFILATFAGLLSTNDEILIKKIIEQLWELTEEDKEDLLDILNRTKLSNVVKTIKEIDNRLQVIEGLKTLFTDFKKETKEVIHIQKILDENFWIFWEQFRLFSSTEWQLKKVLEKYRDKILKNYGEIKGKSRKELDLFLTKTETWNWITRNIIVELKRASIKLKLDNEYRQIEQYKNIILEEDICKWNNQYWEFYLIGNDYDEHIQEYIKNAKNHWEEYRWLTYSVNDWRVKIYVRKWADILMVDCEEKLKFLKEKLQIQSKNNWNNVEDIVNNIIKN